MDVKTRNAAIAVILVIVVVISASLVVLNYGQASDDNRITVTDGIGRQVKIDQNVTRIVSTADTVTAMIYALGLGDRVVGVSSDGNYNLNDAVVGLNNTGSYPSDVRAGIADGSINQTGGTWAQNVEAIVADNPDLVVMDYASYSYNTGIGDKLDSFGIPYFVTKDEVNIDDIVDNIYLLGNALGRSAAAVNITAEMRSSIQSTSAEISNAASHPTVAYLFMGSTTWYAIGNDSFMQSQIDAVGARNAFGNETGWPEIAIEGLLQANPDVIIIDMDMGAGGSTPDYNQIYQEMQSGASPYPLWNELKAVQDGHVYFLTGNARAVAENASIRIVEGVALFAMIAHPELYPDVHLPLVIGDDYQQYIE